ncbi:phage pre-tape measure protein [Vibrio cholerae]
MSFAALEKEEKIKVVLKEKTETRDEVSVQIRGLNAQDFAHLTNAHAEMMKLVFGGKFDFSSEETLGAEFITRAPAFACIAIALACDEPESAHLVAKMPLPIQLELAAAVVELTFPSGVEKDIKKMVNALGVIFQQKKKSNSTSAKNDKEKQAKTSIVRKFLRC